MAPTRPFRQARNAEVVGRSYSSPDHCHGHAGVESFNRLRRVSRNECPRRQSRRCLYSFVGHRRCCSEAVSLGFSSARSDADSIAIHRLAKTFAKMGLPDGRRATRRKPSLRAIAPRIRRVATPLLCAAASSGRGRRCEARGTSRDPRQSIHVRALQTVRPVGRRDCALQVGSTTFETPHAWLPFRSTTKYQVGIMVRLR